MMRSSRILLLSILHLALVFATAFVAEGWDLDQVRSRSSLSTAAGVLHDVLMFPHDAALRSIPNAWLVRNPYVIPSAILVNSLVWGVVLYLLWRTIGLYRGHTGQAQRPA